MNTVSRKRARNVPGFVSGMLAAFAVMAVAACASGGIHPDDMSAEQHRAVASRERAEADEAAAKYDPTATRTRRVVVDPLAGDYDLEKYNPTDAYRTAAERHHEAAAQHLAAAKVLESFEDARCQGLAHETRAMCPLLGQVHAVRDIPDGVEVTVSPETPLDAFMAQVQCHLAFARTEARGGMDACPLFLPDVHVTAREGNKVDFTVDDGDLVGELRRRMATHVDDGE